VGLQLGEAHDLLNAVQHTVVTHQVSAAITAQQPCPHCGQARRHYDGLPRTRRDLGGVAVAAARPTPSVGHVRILHEHRRIPPRHPSRWV